MNLNTKYFFAAFIMFGLQLILGINLASAQPCQDEINRYCSLRKTMDSNWCLDPERTHIEMNAVINSTMREPNEDGIHTIINKFKEHIQREKSNRHRTAADFAEHEMRLCFEETALCMYKKGGRTQDSNTFTDYKGCDGDSQSSSSSSSSQSNKKANRQPANNQSNQNTSNKPQPDPMDEMGDILGGVTASTSASSSSMKPEQAAIVNEASQTYASKTAAFEASHKGLKRKHNKEDEASRCLKMDGRQIANTCDFRVEYIFCAYNPDQNAFNAAFEMAAAFDCERRKMGMQGIPARGKNAGTFTAETVYLFGCKDPSLPSGVTYERGRGLSGWCE